MNQKSGIDVKMSPKREIGYLEDGRLSWVQALDEVKQRLGLIEDKEFAQAIDIPASTLSEFRNMNGNLPLLTKLRLLQVLGYESLAEVISLLLEEDKREKNRRKLVRQSRKAAANCPATND